MPPDLPFPTPFTYIQGTSAFSMLTLAIVRQRRKRSFSHRYPSGLLFLFHCGSYALVRSVDPFSFD